MGQLQHNAGRKILHHNGDFGTNGVIMHDCCCDPPDCNSCDPVMSKTYTVTVTVVTDPSPGANCDTYWEDTGPHVVTWTSGCIWTRTGIDIPGTDDGVVQLQDGGGANWEISLIIPGAPQCQSVTPASGPATADFPCDPTGSYTGGTFFPGFPAGSWTAIVS